MNVVHGLAGSRVHIEHSAITLLMDLELLGQFLSNLKHVADQGCMFRQKIIKRRDVFPGTDQQVNWRLRAEVSECHHEVVLVHKLGRCLTSDDPAKKACLLHDCTLTHFDEPENHGV